MQNKPTISDDKCQSPGITISAQYAPDLERMLRGLLIAYGLPKEEIDRLLEEQRRRNLDKTLDRISSGK